MNTFKNFVNLLFCVFMLNSFNVNAQVAQHFDGTVGNYKKSLVGKGFGAGNDVSTELQALIDDVTAQPLGGTIKLSGEVQLLNIQLKSNVHIDIAKGTVIKATPLKTKPALFQIGIDSYETVRNVKIFCSQSDRSLPNDDISNKYVFDFSEFGINGRIRAVMLMNASNFWISDAYVIDELTMFSQITLNPFIVQTSDDNEIHKGLRDYKVIAAPHKGDVKNIHGINQHGGYGIVQVQCASDVNFEKLSGIGGVTLRLESGSGIQFVGTYNERELGTITGIKGKDLFLKDGFSCVTMSPHGRINGSVYLEDIRSESSCFTVDAATGFYDGELVEEDENGNKYLVDSIKFKKGRFAGPISIKNVHAIFGTTAQGRKHEYDYIEKTIRDAYPWESQTVSPETTKTRAIPSAIAMAYLSIPYANAVPDTIEGEFTVQLRGSITSEGFPSCISTHYNNTVNDGDRNLVNCSLFTSIEENDANELQLIFPNPTNKNIVSIQHPINSTIKIYDCSGKLMKKILSMSDAVTEVDISSFSKGIYLVQIHSGNGVSKQKLSII